MGAEATTSTQAQHARFSRYLSVRRAAAREEKAPPLPEVPPNPEVSQRDEGQINRAPSRYRRPAASRHHDVPVPLKSNVALPTGSLARPVTSRPQPTPEAVTSADAPVAVAQLTQENVNTVHTVPQAIENASRDVDTFHNTARRTTRYRSKTTSVQREDRPPAPRRSYDQAREEARLILEGEYDRLHRLKQQQERVERERRKRAEAKLAEQRDEQAKAGRANAAEEARSGEQAQEQKPSRTRKWTIGTESSHASPPVSAPQSPPPLHRLQSAGENSSREASQDDRRPRTANRQNESPVRPAPQETERPSLKQRVRHHTRSRPREAQSPPAFEPKAGDGPPKTAVNRPAQPVDAPVSAVNAGERRVEIRFDKSKITLPVTPSTTVKDMLNSASIIMSQPINPRTAVLVETYYPLGLERPLRRYERIRDVMNSWDSDTQNYLMILPQSECAAVGLEQKDAPEEQPSHIMVNLYHSQKPGKWEKHWMILKEDGQVTASAKQNDGNAANAFHMSDFDVYMPSRKQMKKLKPPKKICFAIKSQQRSIMFESTENFVHFFATNDKAIADQWYNAAQAWRSWYLVNVLGEGIASKPILESTTTASPTNPHVQPRPSTSQARDSVLYQLGSFQPLLNFTVDAFTYDKEPEPPKQPEAKVTSSPKRSGTVVGHTRNGSATAGLERHASMKRPTMSTQNRHHRRESQNVQIAPSSTDAAFTGTGLLARAFSVKKAQAGDNVAHLENPDSAFTGTGLLARKMSTKKFADENPNPGVIENTNDAFTGAGLLSVQRKMTTKNLANENLNPGVIENTNEAFTGAGLLSVQRSLTKKRSAASARPGQPLVNLTMNSEYSDGSLLRRVEGWEMATGQNLPSIDRSKGVEITSKTGEL